MELDVHLTRDADEPWGLELMGGRDHGTPLTISQVYPSSPANSVGLQPGDVITRIGDHRAEDLHQKQISSLLVDAVGSLGIGVCRGLYDPVLDDFEAIYDTTERADSDLRSEPTEVSPPRYVEYPEHPLSELCNFCPITESRSLTASPFVPQTKPYRPFSTEPLNVPDLEDPIILNPEFKDDFAELLEGIDIDKVETKFKLPVSIQYDPDYRKKIDGIEKSMEREIQVNGRDTVTKQVRFDEFNSCEINDIIEVKIQEHDAMLTKIEAEFEQEMKQEIDMEKIEKTARDVVRDSIERAVSVTEEIQEAIEEELRASATREIVEEKNVSGKMNGQIEELSKENTAKEEMQLETSNIMKIEKEQVARETSELVESKVEIKEREESREIEVKFDKTEISEQPKELLYTRENRKKEKTHEVKSSMTEFVRQEEAKETKKDESKQKVFSIGLQTIPNIRGMAQSSYHFDLLMRTFFIHLTDVMVAMSRFILTQPAIELETKAEKIFKDNLIVGLRSDETVKHNHESQFRSEKTEVKKDVEIKQEKQQEVVIKEAKNIEQESVRETQKSEIQSQKHIELEEIERKRISGAEMAQRTQRKSKDLTNRMDAVITEFETKSGIEEVSERRSRSRSRSRIEEEVMKESDPIEWLDKVNKQSQEKVTKTSSHSESTVSRRSEHESTELSTREMTPGRQMYVAVVESHVYTNKDAILQEMLETSSIESTEEVKATFDIKQQAVEVITQALDESKVIAVAESTVASSESKHEYLDVRECTTEKAVLATEEVYKTAAVETSEVSLESNNEYIVTEVTKQEAIKAKPELLTSVASESTELVQELQTLSFNVAEVLEEKAVEASEESYKSAVVHSAKTLNLAETTDLVVDVSKAESFEAKHQQTETVVVKAEESFKTAAIETAAVVLEEAIEQHAVTIDTQQAKIKETSKLGVAGIIDTKIEEDKIKIPKPVEDEFASLQIIKQEVMNDNSVGITEITESELYKKSIEIENSISQETSSYQAEKLHIRTDIAQQAVLSHSPSDENNNIDGITPPIVPPTPLTDEYVFKLQIPLPKNTGLFIKEDTIEHEDLSIVKKKLIPHIETTVDETIFYDPPLPTPDEKAEPVYSKVGLNGGGIRYTKPGLRGGASIPYCRKEYIREIERKSSLLASAIDQTIKSIEEYKEEVGIDKEEPIVEETNESEEPTPEDELLGYKSVQFAPENSPRLMPATIPVMPEVRAPQPYLSETGAPIGGDHGIVDGPDDATVDAEVEKELGKPGLTEVKIAELISGESEMLREAHVMGLSRVLSTHMNKPDDSSVDFKKLKPINPSLKNSEVIAALNAEILKTTEEKKKDERKWTTFLQKPERPAPRAKRGYYGYLPQLENDEGPYKVKIVKQPKPKIAPDYKPEDFETGPLPWESRALTEPSPPPVEAEDAILIPEESPEFLEAVDPLPESEVPDLQDTGIILPPPKPDSPEPPPDPEETQEQVTEEVKEEVTEEVKEEVKMNGEVEEMAERLVQNVKGMVDPNAPIQQQLAQMRAQLAALAQLPCVIQQSLEMLTNHLATISQQESTQICELQTNENMEEVDLRVERQEENQVATDNELGHVTIEEIGAPELNENTVQEAVPEAVITLTAEEYAALKREEEMLLEEQIRSEKLKKVQEKIEQESRQLKQRAAPRVGKPKMFGTQNPEVRPLVLPGGRRWKGPKDVFNDQFIAETFQAQCEIENWNNIWPWKDSKSLCRQYRESNCHLVDLKNVRDKMVHIFNNVANEAINFMKYEKPPVSLDHLQNSDVYKAVHGMDAPVRRVDLLTPVVAEADYRERCRSMTPGARVEEHLDMPQQLQP